MTHEVLWGFLIMKAWKDMLGISAVEAFESYCLAMDLYGSD